MRVVVNTVCFKESCVSELAASLREFVSTKENMNSFQVYTDENQGVQTRAKRADGQAAQKRTALGQLTNVRQQPARAAKVPLFLDSFCLIVYCVSVSLRILQSAGVCSRLLSKSMRIQGEFRPPRMMKRG